jgi:integrase
MVLVEQPHAVGAGGGEPRAYAPLAPIEASAPPSRDRHPAAVYLARPAAGSRPTMHRALDTIASIVSAGREDAATLDWTSLRYQHTQAVRAVLAERYAPANANKHLSALRGVLKECWRLGLTSAEEHQRAADLETVRGTSLLRGRALSAGEVGGLLGACALDAGIGRAAGGRDAALLAVLYGAGLRRAEGVALDLADYDAEAGALTVRSSKARIACVDGGAKAALEDWLAVRGAAPGPLVVRIRKGDQITQERLSTSGVRHVAVARGGEARDQCGDGKDDHVDEQPQQPPLHRHRQVAVPAQQQDERGEGGGAHQQRARSLLVGGHTDAAGHEDGRG